MINFMKNNTKVFIKEFAEQIREENHIKDYDSLVSFIYSIGGRIEKADCLWDFGAIEKILNIILYYIKMCLIEIKKVYINFLQNVWVIYFYI